MKKPFSIITLTQGTPEWLAWRHDGIGASEASTIMGESHFESTTSLLHKKCNPPIESGMDRAMARGVALEPRARAYYNSRMEIEAVIQCLQSSEHDWLRASLDGITEEGPRAVEIKCGQSAYKTTIKTRRPPRYYFGQFQHILAVTGLDAIDYCCYSPPERTIIMRVERDQSYIDRLLEAEQSFWNEVLIRRTSK